MSKVRAARATKRAGGLCPRCLGALNLDSETGVTGAGAAAAPPPPSALELAPHFPQLEILEVLGRGGMGVVYKVRQKELDRIVALKILPPGTGRDPAFAERFAREAKALARLNHPGIVTIYDSGRTDGLYYFLMEFVDGVSLGRLMRGGRVSAREALALVPQICDALQYAHDQGIVHRDIKPENILLDRQGRVKVADFGLAKLVAGTQETLTPSLSPSDGERVAGRPGEGTTSALTDAGKVMGTPAYMAPEQAEHPGEVDNRADIYALGVVFYQMLTGELPGQRLESPSRKVQIDVRLDEVVLRALEKEPERRYQQVSQVKTAVETIATTPQGRPGVPPASTKSPNRMLNLSESLLAICAPILLVAALGKAYLMLLGPALILGISLLFFSRGRLRKALVLALAISGLAASVVVLFNRKAPQSAAKDGSAPVIEEASKPTAHATNGPALEANTPTNQPPASPRTVQEVLARYTQAKGGLVAIQGTTNLIVEGTFCSRDGLGTFAIEALLKAPDKWMMALNDEHGAVWRRAFDGTAGWEVSKWGGAGGVDAATLLTGRILSGLYRGEQLATFLPMLSLKGKEAIASGEACVLEIALPQGPRPRLWFEAQTGLLVRIEYAVNGSQLQLDLDDYRDIGGLMLPFTLRQTGAENWTVRCREVKRNEPIEDSRFKRPANP